MTFYYRLIFIAQFTGSFIHCYWVRPFATTASGETPREKNNLHWLLRSNLSAVSALPRHTLPPVDAFVVVVAACCHGYPASRWSVGVVPFRLRSFGHSWSNADLLAERLPPQSAKNKKLRTHSLNYPGPPNRAIRRPRRRDRRPSESLFLTLFRLIGQTNDHSEYRNKIYLLRIKLIDSFILSNFEFTYNPCPERFLDLDLRSCTRRHTPNLNSIPRGLCFGRTRLLSIQSRYRSFASFIQPPRVEFGPRKQEVFPDIYRSPTRVGGALTTLHQSVETISLRQSRDTALRHQQTGVRVRSKRNH